MKADVREEMMERGHTKGTKKEVNKVIGHRKDHEGRENKKARKRKGEK